MNDLILEIMLVFVICFAGGFISGVSGFGYAILAMPLLTLFLEVKVAVVVVLLSSLSMFFVIILKMMKKEKVKIIPR